MNDFKIENNGRVASLMANQAISREIIVDQKADKQVVKGCVGYKLNIRLPSYRSLPLSCIEDISVKINGQSVPAEQVFLNVDSAWHALSELKNLHETWWDILDFAGLFIIPSDVNGESDVEVEIVRVEPYITAGRFSFTNISKAKVHFGESNYD